MAYPSRATMPTRSRCAARSAWVCHSTLSTARGEKADLSPLTRESRYRFAFGRRIRQRIEWEGVEPFEVWCARPDNVIFGKLLAWDEGRSQKHRSDIYDMLVFHYLAADPTLIPTFDEAYLDGQASALGPEVVESGSPSKRQHS